MLALHQGLPQATASCPSLDEERVTATPQESKGEAEMQRTPPTGENLHGMQFPLPLTPALMPCRQRRTEEAPSALLTILPPGSLLQASFQGAVSSVPALGPSETAWREEMS